MNRLVFGVCVAVGFALGSSALVGAAPTVSRPDSKRKSAAERPEGRRFDPFKAEATTSNGSVTIDGRTISYQAVAGTLVVHPKDWDDVPRDPNMEKSNPGASEDGGDAKNPTAVASMFYVAYFKESGSKGSEAKGARPITFIFNGGPGSASFWL